MATWTQTEINELKKAIASGVLTVTYSGPPSRSVTYQSLAEMRKLLADMQADVAAEAGTRSNHRFAALRKGL